MEKEDLGKLIPHNYINRLLDIHVPRSLVVGQGFKEQLKIQTEVFVHYLLTYADEIANDKGSKVINETIIKDALFEIDHENIHQHLKSWMGNFSNKKKVVKTIKNKKDN